MTIVTPAHLEIGRQVDLRDRPFMAPLAMGEWQFYTPLLVFALLFGLPQLSTVRSLFPPAFVAVLLIFFAYGHLTGRKYTVRPQGLLLVVVYLAIFTVSLFASNLLDYSATRKLLLVSYAIIPAMFYFRVTSAGLAVFCTALGTIGLVTASSSDTQATALTVSLNSTTSAFESIYSVTFGALACWMLANRKRAIALLCFGFCLVMFKRNAIVAALACMCGYFLLPILGHYRLAFMRLLVAIITVVLAVSSLYLIEIFSWIRDHYLPGLSIEQISTGRTTIYYVFEFAMQASGTLDLLVGHGGGAIETLVTESPIIPDVLTLAHNEYISFIYDFGFLGAFLFFVVLLRNFSGSVANCLVALFLTSIFVIENVFFITFSTATIVFLSSAVFADKNDPNKTGGSAA